MALGKEALGLEEKIGYSFGDVSYLEAALTHSSYTNEMRKRGIKAISNERLEFLGDAVLEIVVSEYLYSSFEKHREGALTKIRQRLVCEKALARAAEKISLGEYLNVGSGEEGANVRQRPKVLADALEALFGAVYLDSLQQQSDSYKGVILSLLADEIDLAIAQKTDYKTMLQQFVEQEGSSSLKYRLVSEEGPEHAKVFTAEALINNNVVGTGTAQTKKDAQMQAAKCALMLFGVIE